MLIKKGFQKVQSLISLNLFLTHKTNTPSVNKMTSFFFSKHNLTQKEVKLWPEANTENGRVRDSRAVEKASHKTS